MDFLPKAINAYSEAHTAAESPLLVHVNRQTHLKTLAPRMLSGHLQGRFLGLISHLMRPQRILEIGTFTGYAALCLAEGLPEEGILYTIEANDELRPLIEAHFQQSTAKGTLKSLIGNALEIIPTLDETFDLVFIDAGKRDYPAYYDLVFDKVAPGGLIIADNILWSGKVVEPTHDKDTQIIDAFNKKVHDDPRVENLLLPLRDGLMIARKRW